MTTNTSFFSTIAAIPRTFNIGPEANTSKGANGNQNQSQSSLQPGTIACIAIGDLVGIAALGLVILYVYQVRKRKSLKLKGGSTKDLEKLPLLGFSLLMDGHNLSKESKWVGKQNDYLQ
ncbi:hypothetical protein ACFX14_035609 [Malus domestica]